MSRITTPLDSGAKSELLLLAYNHSKLKYPNVPDHARVIHKYSDTNANGLTRMITDYLKFSGHSARRVNNTGIFRQGRWTKGTNQPGIADIIAVCGGLPVSIEVKIGSDRLSKDQMRYRDEVTNAGGIFIEARTFSKFLQEFRQRVVADPRFDHNKKSDSV